MEDFYLFGAGINSLSVIDFFREKSIIGIIDNNKFKQGTTVKNIPVISFEDYLEHGKGRSILVTAYYYWDEISRMLRKHGVKKYYRSPWMQNGFYEDLESLSYDHQLKCYEKITMYTDDPISQSLDEYLSTKGVKSNYLKDILSIKDIGEVIVCACIIPKNENWKLLDNFPETPVIKLYERNKQEYNLLGKKICHFSGCHEGERCFLIGNGPSLNYNDLETLYNNNAICFGVNRVYLGYKNTLWRPNYFVSVDAFIISKIFDDICKMRIPVFLRKGAGYPIDNLPDNIYCFNGLVQNGSDFSFDMSKGLYNGFSVMYETLQIACYMGFKEIIMLGMDMSQHKNMAEQDAHFYESPDENEVLGNNGVGMTNAINLFGKAYELLLKNGIVLKNATRNAWWQEVPRINFDDLF